MSRTSKLAKYKGFSGNSPVEYTILGSPNQPSGLSLKVNYELAPVPEHYYYADYFQVVPLDLHVLLIFGKLDHPNLNKLRNKIEIYFPADMFVQQLWRSSRDFESTLADFVKKVNVEPLPPSTLPPETEKVQTLQANNVFMVLSMAQCLMDFYFMSAKDLWLKPRRNEAIGLEPIVRVLVSPSILLGFLQEAGRVAEPYIDRFKIESEEVHATVESE